MRWERMLMQPFSPGRYKDRNGKNRFVSDEAWKRAFPDCKFNKWLDDVAPAPDPVTAKIKEIINRRQTGEASCC